MRQLAHLQLKIFPCRSPHPKCDALLNQEYKNLKKLEKEADLISLHAAQQQIELPLVFKQSKDSEIVTFKGYDYTSELSSLSGGQWFKYSKTSANWQIPYFNKQEAKEKAKLPSAYIIPPEWTDVIKRLDLHGIKYTKLTKNEKYKVNLYKFSNVEFSTKPYEGRFRVHKFNMAEYSTDVEYPKGSVIVPTNQRTARVIAHILEPKAYDSFLNWGFFNAIFEQKEYGESYVMEGLAREMLAKDASLKSEFEKKLNDDKKFASNPEAILNWFYTISDYRDQRMNVYPVGKIYHK